MFGLKIFYYSSTPPTPRHVVFASLCIHLHKNALCPSLVTSRRFMRAVLDNTEWKR